MVGCLDHDIVNSCKGHMYKTFESTFGYEKYLSILQSKLRKIKIKFNFERKNHRLPVETCGWLGIHLNERCCTFCNKN